MLAIKRIAYLWAAVAFAFFALGNSGDTMAKSQVLALSSAVPISSIRQELLTLPVIIDGRSFRLEAQVLTPPGRHKKPLAVITQGSPRKPSNRKQMTTYQYLSRAMEFARRGYVTAIVMRRGYGQSTGQWFESYGRCDAPNYKRAAETTAKDIIGAISALSKQPGVDSNRVLVVGQSAGGIGAVAVASKNPPGVIATINFAGGRGSRSQGKVCKDRALVGAYSQFGKTAVLPSLWVYTRNDGYFGPALSQRFHQAFTASGGNADYILTSAFGKDGHKLFSRKGIARWRPLVDDFLRKNGLPTWKRPPSLPASPNIAAPFGFSNRGKQAWKNYLVADPNKAFARSLKGKRFGWRTSRNSVREAEDGALKNCRASDCVVVSVNGSAPR